MRINYIRLLHWWGNPVVQVALETSVGVATSSKFMDGE